MPGQENKANFNDRRQNPEVRRQKKKCKTKPIYLYCVMREEYCVRKFEKTKPIYSYCVMSIE